MKKLNLLLLLIFSVISLNISAHDFEVVNSDGKTIYYNITSSTDLTLSVTYRGNSYSSYSNEYEGAIIIPLSVTYNGETYSVTSIGEDAFSYCSGLTSVTIGNSVTSIGEDAFRFCSSLTTIIVDEGNTKYDSREDCNAIIESETNTLILGCKSTIIPNSVTSIGSGAFLGCSGLTSVTIGNSVTSIDDHAFSACSGLTSVTIGNSVASIGSSAFSGCSGLTSVTIGDSVTSIGSSAFWDCSGLTSVIIPNSVTSIDNYAFYGCSGLTSVTIGNSVTSIGSYVFHECSSLTSVTIPNSVTSIGSDAFSYCSGLTSVTIGNSVTSIGYHAFSGCSGLTSVAIPNSVTSIADYAFSGCSGLKSVTIGNSVTSIESGAFSYCSSLTSVAIPNSVTSIDEDAFRYCSSLTSVTIGDGVTSIGDNAFEGCSGLTGVYINDLTAWCNIDFGKSYTNPLYYAEKLYLNNELVTDLIIPNSVTSIGDNAFYNCSSLTSVTIPNSVTSIESGAFDGCSSLTSVTIPNSVTSIGDYAFRDCSSLTSVTIPNSVTSIGDFAFRYCSSLTSVTIGDGVTSIGSYAFLGCSGLKELTLEDGEETLSLGNNGSGEGLFYDCPLETLYLGRNLSYKDSPFYGKTTLTSVTIGDSVTSIGDCAFWGCSGLTSATIGDSVISIGDEAFSKCTGLTSVTIPNSVTSIGKDAFWSCSGLTFLTIPNSVISIGNGAFSYCSGLTSVTIPNSVTSIGNDAFSCCSGLTSATIGNSVTSIGDRAFSACSGLTSVTIPNSVTSIGSDAFSGCSGLTSVTIGNSVTSIGDYAFEGCSGLKELTIEDGEETLSFGAYVFVDCPLESLYLGRNHSYEDSPFKLPTLRSVTIGNSVTSIRYNAFQYCSGLTSATIGNSVTSIGDNAFSYCSALTSVTIPNSVTSIGNYAFWLCSSMPSVTIPNSVTTIGNGAFWSCSSLPSVTIPNSVTSIGDEAFWGCSGLSSVTIGNSVTSIGERAFYGCGGLTSVTIPNSVTSIGSGAFWDCSGLTSVNIGDSVTSIGDNAFYNCRGLTSVAIPNSVTSIGGSAFRGCSGLTSVTIPNSVTSIDDYAFLGCRELKQLTIEDGEETLSLGNNGLGTGLFNDCPLESLYLGRNLSYDTNSLSLNGDLHTTDLSSTDRTNIEKTAIAEKAYCATTAIQQNSGNGAGHYLRGFTLSDGTSSIEVTDIQPTPLSSIYSDKTSYILTTSPGATLSISAVDMARPEWMHAYVFIDYDNDKEFNQTTNSDGTTGGEVVSFNYYNGSNSKGQTGISENCQVLASNIPSWTLPTDLQLGEYRLRFKIDWNSIDACGAANIAADNGCIVDVTIVVAETGYSPFYNKTTLTSLTIGNSVTSIGENAFSGCSGLTEIYSLNPEPAICNGNSFSQVDKTIPVYIPYGSMSAYKSATEWKDFTNFIEGESNDKEITEDEVLDKDETWGDVNIAPEENKDVILDVNVNIFQAENITINIDKDGKTPQISISVGGEVITKNIKVTRNIKGGIWTMLSLPFDIEISDILVENAQVEIGTNLLVRIYDAAYRAANSVDGKTANGWKEKTSGIIPANQGFAVAINSRYDGDVQEVTFLGRDFAMDGNDKELTLNRHHSTANGGKDADWNFCGNPTLSNQEKESGHSLYVYNSEKNSYDEYSSSQSATYLPFSAWFVQSANDFISMVFSTTSKVIKSENENVEGIITLAINDGDDETSVILNSEASTAYQRNEDALYMESPNTNLSQLYIVEGNTQMAVSEQPAVEDVIKIGYKAAQAGEQTLTLTNLPDNTIAALEDNQTGEQTLMSVGDSYSFTTAAGTNNNRFNLRLTELTGIDQPGTTALKAVVTGDEIKLYGTEAGEQITLYTANGMIITNAVAEESVTTIPTTATGVIIIKVGDEIVKVVK